MHPVYFDCYWTDQAAFFEALKRQTPGSSGKWNSIEGTPDPTEADYHVAFDSPTEVTDPQRTLVFNAEPPCLIAGRRIHEADALRIYPLSSHHKPMRWGKSVPSLDRTYDELKDLEPMKKSKDLSWVISDKGKEANLIRQLMLRFDFQKHRVKSLPFPDRFLDRLNLLDNPTDGQIIRMNLLDAISETYPGLLDHYGRGDFSGPCYRGEISQDQKFEVGYRDYRYTLALDNYKGRNYFSEKLGDAYLSWCMPIYWGCINLDEYFPEDSYVWIDAEADDFPQRIREIVESDRREENLDAIREARRRVLDEYQVWPTVERCIQSIETAEY